MSLISDLSSLLAQLNLQPEAKEELLRLAAVESRTSEQSARLKELLTTLRGELLEDYALMAREETVMMDADRGLADAEHDFQADLVLLSRMAAAGAKLAFKRQEKDNLSAARTAINEA